MAEPKRKHGAPILCPEQNWQKRILIFVYFFLIYRSLYNMIRENISQAFQSQLILMGKWVIVSCVSKGKK